MAPIDFHSRKKITIEDFNCLVTNILFTKYMFNWRKKWMSDDNVEDERSQVSMTYQMYHVELLRPFMWSGERYIVTDFCNL